MHLNQTSNSEALLVSNRASSRLKTSKREGKQHIWIDSAPYECKLTFCAICCHSPLVHADLKLIASNDSALCCVVPSATQLDPGGTIKKLFSYDQSPWFYLTNIPLSTQNNYRLDLKAVHFDQCLILKL